MIPTFPHPYAGRAAVCGGGGGTQSPHQDNVLWKGGGEMTLSECIERERRIKAGFRRQFVFTVSAVLLFSAAALLLLGYERIYMGNILRWIIDALAPLGEAIAAACTQGDAAALYLSVMESEAALLVMQMVVYVLTLGIPFFCCRRAVLRRTARRDGPAMPRRPFAVMLLALGGGYIASVVGSLLFSWMPQGQTSGGLPESFVGVVLYFVSVAILPALIEDWAFRGVVLRALLPYGRTFVVFFSSALFGLMHLDPAQSVFAFTFALVLAFVYASTGSLWMCVFLHAVNNAISFLAGYVTLYGGEVSLVLMNGYMIACMLSAGVLFVYWLVRRRASPFFTEPSAVSAPRLRAGGLLSSAALNAFAVVFALLYVYFIYLQYWVMS